MIKYSFIYFIVTLFLLVGFIESERTQIKFGEEIIVNSKNIKLFGGNSKKLLLGTSNDGSFYLFDKNNFEQVRNRTFIIKDFINPYAISGYLEEENKSIYIVASKSEKSKTKLYKFDINFKLIGSASIANDSVVPNQLESLNYDNTASSSIITFVGAKGIHRFKSDTLLLQTEYFYNDGLTNFKVSSISYINHNLLNIAGKNNTKPSVLRYILNNYPSTDPRDRSVIPLPTLVEHSSDIFSIQSLLNFKKSFSYITSPKRGGNSINLISHALESKIEESFEFSKPSFSVSDTSNFAIYAIGRKIVAYQIGQNKNGSIMEYIAEKNYPIRESENIKVNITGLVYCPFNNQFFFSTSDGHIQSFSIINPHFNEYAYKIYPTPDPSLHHNRVNDHSTHRNKWWRILFSIIGVVTGLILFAGLISLYIVFKKGHLLERLLDNVNRFNQLDGNNNNNNNNDNNNNNNGFKKIEDDSNNNQLVDTTSININNAFENEKDQENDIEIDTNEIYTNNNQTLDNNSNKQTHRNGESYEL
ncbi:hypothetical protein RB653_008965 [Dictyostelium firmibasis]|uniref:Uncharacterized protein n=1 Tax=Dictyostelium firmibasis TaxID=79012 RepID=A0AAN7TTJ0_9MYCE